MGNRLISQCSPLLLPHGGRAWRSIAPLAAALIFALSLSASSLNLTWNDNSDNEEGFEIERSPVGGEFSLLASVDPNTADFVDTSVVPGREYQYRVRAFNAFGYSGYTNVSQGSVENTPPSLGEVESISVLKGAEIGELLIPISDAQTPLEYLSVEALSSDLSVLPLEAISMEVREGAIALRLSSTGAVGSSLVTVLASDGVAIAQRSFDLEIQRNLAPTVGAVPTQTIYDAQEVGPVAVSISDAESPVDALQLVATSLDEQLIDPASIRVEGTGSQRQVYFTTRADVSGAGSLRLQVSDGVNTTNGAIPFSISVNKAPTIGGLESAYTLAIGEKLAALPLSLSDKETDASALEVSVTASNAALISSSGIRVRGTGAQRTLDLTPNAEMYGVAEVTVSVSDGDRTTQAKFTLTVLAPDAKVEILDFSVVEGLAVIEVAKRPGATFSLLRIYSRSGAWETVTDIEQIEGPESVTLIDPTPITDEACFRVVASQ